jgi:hypothetical protein
MEYVLISDLYAKYGIYNTKVLMKHQKNIFQKIKTRKNEKEL